MELTFIYMLWISSFLKAGVFKLQAENLTMLKFIKHLPYEKKSLLQLILWFCF